MVFGDGLQRDTPPKIPVNLNVPVVPTGIGGIAPAFFLEQLEDRAQQIMPVAAPFAPKDSASQTADSTSPRRQIFVRANYTPRCSFKMQPGEIPRPPSHEWLDESQEHDEE